MTDPNEATALAEAEKRRAERQASYRRVIRAMAEAARLVEERRR